MPFNPMPGEQIQIGGRAFSFIQHRVFVTPAPHAEKGARGTVYLVYEGQSAWALKVFKPPYRKPSQTTVAARLQALKDVPGLRAAGRLVVEPGDPILATHKDLVYAQLMPWVEGIPWSNVIDTGTRKNDCYLSPAHGFHLCSRFLETMSAMEQRGLSHTDIAGGNVIVNPDQCSAELIDLEEMFGPSFPQPDRLNRGSQGYAHPVASNLGLWGPASDRFAGMIMSAEMLLVTSPDLSVASDTAGGYFANDEFGSDSPRVRAARDYLTAILPEFAALFARAWSSQSLEDCPTLREVSGLIQAYLHRVPAPQGPAFLLRGQPAPWAPPLRASGPPPFTPPAAPLTHNTIVDSWKPLGPASLSPQPSALASWDQASPIAATASPSFRAPRSPPPIPMPMGSEDVTIPMTDGSAAMAAGAATLPVVPLAVSSTPPAPPETVYFSRAGVRISSVTIAASGAEIALQDVRSVVAGVVPPGRKVEAAVGGLGAAVLLLGLLLKNNSAALTAVVIVCTTIVVALRRAHVPAVNIECIDGRVYTVNVPDPAVAEEICSASYQARLALPPPQMYSAVDAAGRPGA